MVLGVPLFPMLALSGYIGYKAWPYLSESKREIPKNIAFETGRLMYEDVLGRLLSTASALFLVGLSAYAVKVLWTGESGFWPTLAKLVVTEALIIGLSVGMGIVAVILYENDPSRFDSSRDLVAERFGETTFTLANFAFIPIAVSKLALEATDNRKTATVAGIMALAVSSALTGAVIYEGFFA